VTPDFKTDAEFASLFPVHTKEERDLLTASILAHGVREPLVVWREEKLLLDGHSRLAVCKQHDVAFEVVEYSFRDRHAARCWVIDNALARRNLTEEQRRYLRGKRLLAEKKDKTENLRRGATPPIPQSEGSGETAARIAKREGVSRATVERDAEYARDVDKISETCPKARAAILTGKVKLTRDEVARAAEKAPRSLGQVKKAAAAKPAAPARRVDRDHVGEIDTLALRLSAAIDGYTKSGLRSSDRPRLKSLWELRAEIEGLNAALKGQE